VSLGSFEHAQAVHDGILMGGPPEPTPVDPCPWCDEEKDLPKDVEIFVGNTTVCFECLRDYLVIDDAGERGRK